MKLIEVFKINPALLKEELNENYRGMSRREIAENFSAGEMTLEDIEFFLDSTKYVLQKEIIGQQMVSDGAAYPGRPIRDWTLYLPLPGGGWNRYTRSSANNFLRGGFVSTLP